MGRCALNGSVYSALKDHLSPPARRVVEELIEERKLPPEVVARLVAEQQCPDAEAWGYVREVLWWALIELTGAELRLQVDWAD